MTVITGRMAAVGLGPAECSVQPAWKVASPAAMGPWVSTSRSRWAISAVTSRSDSSLMDSPETWPIRWLPATNDIDPTSGSRSASGIHMVMVWAESNGQ